MKNPYRIWELQYISSCMESMGTYSIWPQAIPRVLSCWYLDIHRHVDLLIMCVFFSSSQQHYLTEVGSLNHILHLHCEQDVLCLSWGNTLCCCGTCVVLVCSGFISGLMFLLLYYETQTVPSFPLVMCSVSDGGINHLSSLKTPVYFRLSPYVCFNWVWNDRRADLWEGSALMCVFVLPGSICD